MAGYTYKWDCRICKEPQDTMNIEKLRVCELCLANLAEFLCNAKLGHSIEHLGIDRGYWMEQARRHARFLLKRWKETRLALHV